MNSPRIIKVAIGGGIIPAFLLAPVLLGTFVFGQPLPDKIRGYKLHKEKVEVSVSPDVTERTDASVKFGDPKLIEADVTGVTFEIAVELAAVAQTGEVDFLAFHDVRVNGVSVKVEEYRDPFEFRKGQSLVLPQPARIFLPTTGIIQAAWKEMRDSKAEWTVTGRVFVFGRFRRYGMYHKRVIPIDIDTKIKNPIS